MKPIPKDTSALDELVLVNNLISHNYLPKRGLHECV